MRMSHVRGTPNNYGYESPHRKNERRPVAHQRSKCFSTPERKIKKPHQAILFDQNALQAPRKSFESAFHQDRQECEVFRIEDDDVAVQGALFDATFFQKDMDKLLHVAKDTAGEGKPFLARRQMPSLATATVSSLPRSLPTAKVTVDSPDCLSKFHAKPSDEATDCRATEGLEELSNALFDDLACSEDIEPPVVSYKVKAATCHSRVRLTALKAFQSPDSVAEAVHSPELDKENVVNHAELPKVSFNSLFVSPRDGLKRTASVTALAPPAFAKPSHSKSNPRLRQRGACESLASTCAAEELPSNLLTTPTKSERRSDQYGGTPTPCSHPSPLHHDLVGAALRSRKHVVVAAEARVCPDVALVITPKKIERKKKRCNSIRSSPKLKRGHTYASFSSTRHRTMSRPLKFVPVLPTIHEAKVYEYMNLFESFSPVAMRRPEHEMLGSSCVDLSRTGTFTLADRTDLLFDFVRARDLKRIKHMFEESSADCSGLVQMTDHSGNTPLLLAGKNGWRKGVRYFISQGATNYEGLGLSQLGSTSSSELNSDAA